MLYLLILIAILVTLLALYFAYSKLWPAHVQALEANLNKQEMRGLSLSRDQFKKLFEEAPIPYFILNNKCEITDLNKAGLRFFHAVPEDIIHKDFFSFVAEEDAEYARYLSSSCMSGAPLDKKEIRMISKKGEKKWVQLSVLGITESNNKSLTSLATVFDITDQKNLDQAKTEFVSLASHQLRTPLASIKWYLEMFAHSATGELNPKQTEYLKVLSGVTADMIDLVDTLLNVSRIEIGKISIETKPTNAQEVTDSVLVELATQINKKKMVIVKQYNDILTGMKSDPKLLRIVIHNLFTNAIKYTPEGGMITVQFEDTGGRNQITVTDNGYGIPLAQQDKIFTKMFRADNVKDVSTSQSTGLGLYLVKSLVEAMGGAISFHSVEGKGTSFMVSF
ncbi:MAG: PAS domain-containing sensor histidine kinase [Candidatus Taylorbacteria bacterium]|nr:PAS domain-containing sensor histidine kinase [Candidatus Taylorbacteria bacterium]